MGKLNEWCIRTDIKMRSLRNRAAAALLNEHGVETGEVVVLLAIFALFATFVANKLGVSIKDKAEQIVNSIVGATWSP